MNDWKSSVPQDDNIFIKFKAQAYPTNQLPQEGIFQSKVMQILAKTKFSIEPGIDMNYYNANYSTPAELPDEVYDRSKKYYRNRLGLYKNHLIVPRSETGNILRIYDLKFDKPKSTIRLSTPITQIVANGKKMLVKTMGHVYCLNENFLDSEMLTAEVSDMFSFLNFGMEPLHIASSRIINEAIVLLPNGDVNIWDLHSNASSKWGDLILFGKDNTSSRLEPSEIHFDPTEYFTCEFATHPKQILLSNGDFAILGDLRSNSLNNPILYQASDNEKIADLKANPFIPYQVALAIGSKVILRDSRFLKKVRVYINLSHYFNGTMVMQKKRVLF